MLQGIRHAVHAAETIRHSICDCFGLIRAYEMRPPSGKIVTADKVGSDRK
jgi:hypothetical protein